MSTYRLATLNGTSLQVTNDRSKLLIAARGAEQFDAGPVGHGPAPLNGLRPDDPNVFGTHHQLFQRVEPGNSRAKIIRHV